MHQRKTKHFIKRFLRNPSTFNRPLAHVWTTSITIPQVWPQTQLYYACICKKNLGTQTFSQLREDIVFFRSFHQIPPLVPGPLRADTRPIKGFPPYLVFFFCSYGDTETLSNVLILAERSKDTVKNNWLIF